MVSVKLQWSADGLPPPPLPSQPLAQRKLPSSAATLWKPWEPFWKVTVSPTETVSVAGVNARPGPVPMVKLAALAGEAASAARLKRTSNRHGTARVERWEDDDGGRMEILLQKASGERG